MFRPVKGSTHKITPMLQIPFTLNSVLLCYYYFVLTFCFSSHRRASVSVFEQEAERGVASAELTEQKIGLMLLEVCHKAGGSNYLRQIYHIIQGNEVGTHSFSPAIKWLLA